MNVGSPVSNWGRGSSTFWLTIKSLRSNFWANPHINVLAIRHQIIFPTNTREWRTHSKWLFFQVFSNRWGLKPWLPPQSTGPPSDCHFNIDNLHPVIGTCYASFAFMQTHAKNEIPVFVTKHAPITSKQKLQRVVEISLKIFLYILISMHHLRFFPRYKVICLLFGLDGGWNRSYFCSTQQRKTSDLLSTTPLGHYDPEGNHWKHAIHCGLQCKMTKQPWLVGAVSTEWRRLPSQSSPKIFHD